MDDATKILILGGVLNIAYGLLTGIAAGMIRQNHPTYSKYLRFVHIGALMWGPILLSLSWAVAMSTLDAGLETVGAILMVGASVLLDVKDTINWLQGTQDEFAEKARIPLALGTLSALASLAGIAIFTLGVIQGL